MYYGLLSIFLLLFSFLHSETRILAFAGSSREHSYNKQLIREAAAIAEAKGAKVTVIELNHYPIPIYDADLEANHGMPENAKRLRKLMIESDAIMIATPEYNGSIPALLKNVIDWASRDEQGHPSRTAFMNKRFAIMSASPSPQGGKRGLEHLQTIIEAIGGTVMTEQTTIPVAHQYFAPAQRSENSFLNKEISLLVEYP